MKKIGLLFLTILFIGFGCQKTKIGYLVTKNAEYIPNSIVVRKNLDPEQDAKRIMNKAPWISPKIQGVLGTNPINYEIVDIVASAGGDAAIFKKYLTIRGAGLMELPLYSKVPSGKYLISIKAYNEGYEAIIKDAFTFIVE
ncbi:MAG: hypothetical protein Q4G63_07725 [Bacteroidia bacterium]|nr:hypothetical protein [Bacteroidia bacterium]